MVIKAYHKIKAGDSFAHRTARDGCCIRCNDDITGKAPDGTTITESVLPVALVPKTSVRAKYEVLVG